jgi:hypothetical protein
LNNCPGQFQRRCRGLSQPLYLAIPAAFLCSGLSEFVGAFLLALLCVRKEKWLIGPALAGLLVNLLAPGNSVRAESFHHASVLFTAAHTLKNYDSVLAFVADPRLVIFGLFLAPRQQDSKWLPVILVGLMLGSFAALTFTLGGPPPPRILNILYFVAAVGWVYQPYRIEAPFMGLVLGAAMLVAPNVGAMVRDLPDTIRGQHSQPLLDASGPGWADRCIAKWTRART